MLAHDTECVNTNLLAGMGQGDEKAELFEKIDILADDELTEMQRRLERARDHIDDAGRMVTAQIEGDAPHVKAAGKPAPAKKSPALSASAAAAKSELEAFLAQPAEPAAPAAPPAPKAPTPPVVRDAPDFGDIAASIATDDDWKS